MDEHNDIKGDAILLYSSGAQGLKQEPGLRKQEESIEQEQKVNRELMMVKAGKKQKENLIDMA